MFCIVVLSAISFFISRTDAFSNESDQPAADSSQYQCEDGTVTHKLDDCIKEH